MAMLRSAAFASCLACVATQLSAAPARPAPAPARPSCVVFWQEGFPTVESQPIGADDLRRALQPFDLVFAGVEDLSQGEVLGKADLLVLPYGSAFPAEAWSAIRDYVFKGGNLLNIGGRPFFAPVTRQGNGFAAGHTRNAFAREMGFWHSYETPRRDWVRLAWDDDFSFEPPQTLKARRVFVVATGPNLGGYRGLAYLESAGGEKIAAPLTRQDHLGNRHGPATVPGARSVYLNFEPEPGYWSSADGVRLIGWAEIGRAHV
jgi:hypothetical protein